MAAMSPILAFIELDYLPNIPTSFRFQHLCFVKAHHPHILRVTKHHHHRAISLPSDQILCRLAVALAQDTAGGIVAEIGAVPPP